LPLQCPFKPFKAIGTPELIEPDITANQVKVILNPDNAILYLIPQKEVKDSSTLADFQSTGIIQVEGERIIAGISINNQALISGAYKCIDKENR
jgi:hypothetical protein